MKRNILYVVLELFAGGLENGIVNLINHSSDQFNHVICCLRKKGVFEKRLIKKARIIELNMKFGNDYTLPKKIASVIKNEQIDIIRAFNQEPFFYSFLPAKFTRKPIIYYNGGRTFPEKKKLLILEKLFGNFSETVIVPSTGLKNYMSRKIGIKEHLIEVIYNGVDINRFSCKIEKVKKKTELGIPHDHLVIGTVGRLVDQKDLFTFLRIAKIVSEFRKNVTFLIVGDGEKKQELHEYAKMLLVERHVRFLGIRHDIDEIYHIMDFFLLTSKWEGMSNVCLEAMASRKIVMATNVEGINEIITDRKDGFIMNIGDADGFAKEIVNLNEGKRMEIGENAFRKVAKTFSITKMVDDYERLYSRIAI